jgi:hypothetical protein
LSELEKEEEMKIVCAWCNKLVSGEAGDTAVSHGICKPCYDVEIESMSNVKEDGSKINNPCLACNDWWYAERNTNCREACPRLAEWRKHVEEFNQTIIRLASDLRDARVGGG